MSPMRSSPYYVSLAMHAKLTWNRVKRRPAINKETTDIRWIIYLAHPWLSRYLYMCKYVHFLALWQKGFVPYPKRAITRCTFFCFVAFFRFALRARENLIFRQLEQQRSFLSFTRTLFEISSGSRLFKHAIFFFLFGKIYNNCRYCYLFGCKEKNWWLSKCRNG